MHRPFICSVYTRLMSGRAEISTCLPPQFHSPFSLAQSFMNGWFLKNQEETNAFCRRHSLLPPERRGGEGLARGKRVGYCKKTRVFPPFFIFLLLSNLRWCQILSNLLKFCGTIKNICRLWLFKEHSKFSFWDKIMWNLEHLSSDLFKFSHNTFKNIF
jgi:hypothetical protein